MNKLIIVFLAIFGAGNLWASYHLNTGEKKAFITDDMRHPVETDLLWHPSTKIGFPSKTRWSYTVVPGKLIRCATLTECYQLIVTEHGDNKSNSFTRKVEPSATDRIFAKFMLERKS